MGALGCVEMKGVSMEELMRGCGFLKVVMLESARVCCVCWSEGTLIRGALIGITSRQVICPSSIAAENSLTALFPLG